ncbi:MAG: helix-hairpin-helix domain-containing protein [Pyrinomonadaceae bacterium]
MKRDLGKNTKAARALIVVATLSLVPSCVRPTRVRSKADDTSSTGRVRAATAGKININTASVEELEKLPGIGTAVAARIFEHRENYGPFRKPEHLIVVQGISDREFRKMRDLIVAE